MLPINGGLWVALQTTHRGECRTQQYLVPYFSDLIENTSNNVSGDEDILRGTTGG